MLEIKLTDDKAKDFHRRLYNRIDYSYGVMKRELEKPFDEINIDVILKEAKEVEESEAKISMITTLWDEQIRLS